MKFSDLPNGTLFYYHDYHYVKIDSSCDFSEDLPESSVVEVSTGKIFWFGTDNEIELVARDIVVKPIEEAVS